MSYYVSPNLFFLLRSEGLLVWDYKNHTQYILEESYFSVLHDISRGLPIREDLLPILKELEDGELVLTDCDNEIDEWGWDLLSRIFHLGTQNVYSESSVTDEHLLSENYLNECEQLSKEAPNLFSEKEGPLISLPDPALDILNHVSFLTALKKRKTCRHFFGKAITLQDLSTLLFVSFGLIHGDSWSEYEDTDLKVIGMRKSAPASGGLHSEEAYVAVYQVVGLEPGIYHYRPQDHKLTLIQPGNFEEKIIAANYKQFYSRGLACGVYLTSRLDKIWWKYKHSKAYKVTLLDLGHASQSFLLAATALNLQTWLTAAFQEQEISDLLKLEGVHESPFLFLGVGYGTGQAVPDEVNLVNESGL